MPRHSTTKPRPPRRAAARPQQDWSGLVRSSWYARNGRPLFNAALVLALLPLALVAGACVALLNLVAFGDPRKILYVQPRVGLRGKVFRIYKFRTMREPRATAHESWRDGEERARVTRLGRLLRNTHLDELPQLINVLIGDMNVIGPRPEMVEIEAWASEHVPGFARRLALKPGITGIAQITQGYTGHDVEAYAQKLAINLRYMKRLSLRLDLEICARTVIWMVRGKGWDWARGRSKHAAPSTTTLG
jgi:lipopolysaccharide/colanic/teichoic acid biosynthesis glycosyltransferase